MKALVSIVMPVKNTSRYLKICLDSILDQSFTAWELIAIDDHSTDDCWQILTDYAAKDARIKVFKNVKNGIISALQLAYKHSVGVYITRMDSDDIMASNKVSSMINSLENSGPNHLAVGCVKYFHEIELGDGYQRYETWLNDLTIASNNYSEIYKECSIPSPCWMTSRNDFDRSGGFLSEIYPEDYDLAFRFRKAGLKVIGIDEVLHHWRDYSTRSSRTDDNYADNKFVELKIHHFLQQDFNKEKTLSLWGAGRKGKAIAKSLITHNIPFDWYCNSESKIGKDIYGIRLKDSKYLAGLINCQIIISISAKSANKEIDSVIMECIECDFYRFT